MARFRAAARRDPTIVQRGVVASDGPRRLFSTRPEGKPGVLDDAGIEIAEPELRPFRPLLAVVCRAVDDLEELPDRRLHHPTPEHVQRANDILIGHIRTHAIGDIVPTGALEAGIANLRDQKTRNARPMLRCRILGSPRIQKGVYQDWRQSPAGTDAVEKPGQPLP